MRAGYHVRRVQHTTNRPFQRRQSSCQASKGRLIQEHREIYNMGTSIRLLAEPHDFGSLGSHVNGSWVNVLTWWQEIACFSYDDKHEFHLGESSLKWYYPPELGTDLSEGFETFDKHDDSGDEHLDSLLKTIIAHEQEQGKKIDAQVVTWRGMMTKVRTLYRIHPLALLTTSRSCRLYLMTETGIITLWSDM